MSLGKVVIRFEYIDALYIFNEKLFPSKEVFFSESDN